MKPIPSELNRGQRRRTQYSLLSGLLPLLAVLLWVGCKPEAKVAADINPAGNYSLVSVDGKTVPCALAHEGHTMSIQSGVFIINADGTCSSTVNFSLPSGGNTRREVKASYTQAGSTLTMKWEGAGMTSGTVEGDTFTMNNEGMIFTYRK